MIFFTEVLNILMDFWYTNVFGGIWVSIILFVNWILIFVTGREKEKIVLRSIVSLLVCCTTTLRASTCSLVWHVITVVACALLIAFDIVFVLNPYTCLLTSTCSSQSQVISLNFLMQTLPQFSTYTSYDSKQLILEIQLGCTCLAFLLSIVYIIIFVVCRLKLMKNGVKDMPPTPKHGFRVAKAPELPWVSPVNFQPYTPV